MKPCFVYVIAEVTADPKRDKVFCKVGISSNPQARLRELQTGCPLQLRLYGAIKLPSRWAAFEIERHYHNVNAPWTVSGEWTRSMPDGALDEVGAYCVEAWFGAGLDIFDIAERCKEAGISCVSLASCLHLLKEVPE